MQVKDISKNVLLLIDQYLSKHKKTKTKHIVCPLRHADSKHWTSQWDSQFIDACSRQVLFDLGDAADKLKLYDLRDLVCAKIASLVYQVDQNEVVAHLKA